MIVREVWEKGSDRCDASALVAGLDHRPAAVLHGDGEWVLHAAEPLARFTRVPPPDLVLQRRGDVPPLQPDLVGWFTYEYGLTLDPAFPAPRPSSLPGSRWTLYRRLTLWHRPTGTVWRLPGSGDGRGAGKAGSRVRPCS